MTQVVLPQAFRLVVPPLASVFIALTKNTSIAMAFGIAELTFRLKQLLNEYATDRIIIFIAIATCYIVIVAVISCRRRDARATLEGRAMSTVLYDNPGPRARRRNRIVGARRGPPRWPLASSGRSGSSARTVSSTATSGRCSSPRATSSCSRVALVDTLQAAVFAIAGAVVFGVIFGVGKLSDHRGSAGRRGSSSSSSAPCRCSCSSSSSGRSYGLQHRQVVRSRW